MNGADGEFCIVKGYTVVAFDLPEPRLCKKSEAKAVDTAFNAVVEKTTADGKWDQKEAARAATQALAAVRAGKARPATSASHGCV